MQGNLPKLQKHMTTKRVTPLYAWDAHTHIMPAISKHAFSSGQIESNNQHRLPTNKNLFIYLFIFTLSMKNLHFRHKNLYYF